LGWRFVYALEQFARGAKEEPMAETDRQQVIVHKGFFPAVTGEDVHIEDAGGVIFVARRNQTVSQGGAQCLIAGRDQILRQAGGQWLIAGRNQTLEQSGGAILASRHARVTNGFVGLLVAGRVTLDGSARALLTLSAPALAAAAAGLALGLLWGRRRG
jgi:hypothetical protein